MRRTYVSRLRALPLLAALAGTSALAEPMQATAADIPQLLQAMQERLTRLETRNAELERRLAEGASASGKDGALSARIEDLESEVVALSRKPDPMARFEGVSVGASLTMVAQHAKSGGVDESQATARADVEIELPGGSIGDAQGRIFAHLRAGDGDGLTNNAFATSNATAFNFSQPALMQAWYQLDVPVGGRSGNLGQFEVTVGKIDPFGFFDGNNLADDESEGFLNLAFVHNPLLDAGGDIGVGTHGASPGLRLAYVSDINGGNHVTASLGVFGAGSNGANYLDSFSKPFTIAQLEYAGKVLNGREGAYRLYAWNNARADDAINGGTERHAGWGISLDQQVTDHAGLFARYGDSTKGNLNFDRAFTLGGQLSGASWGRDDDRIGLAFGTLKTSAEYRNAGSGSGSERITELFYAWQANKGVQLTPSLQYISNASGTGGGGVTVWGLRAKASY